VPAHRRVLLPSRPVFARPIVLAESAAGLLVAIGQDHDIVVSRDKCVREYATDEAAAACNDDVILHPPIQLKVSLPPVVRRNGLCVGSNTTNITNPMTTVGSSSGSTSENRNEIRHD